ncbi:MAG: hypothetical protein WB681_14105 [Candidatus Cybelea sp.]
MSYVARLRIQPVAARTVAGPVVDLATRPPTKWAEVKTPEIAGPREEDAVDLAKMLVGRRGEAVRIESGRDPADPDNLLLENGALMPGPHAMLAGPTFEEWLDTLGRP